MLKNYIVNIKVSWKEPNPYVIAAYPNLKGRFMSEVSKKVAEMLLSTESIQVYKETPFVFVSGRISPVYIDCRKLLSFPTGT